MTLNQLRSALVQRIAKDLEHHLYELKEPHAAVPVAEDIVRQEVPWIKGKKFENEKETRIVRHKGATMVSRVRAKGGRLVSYVEVPLPDRAIRIVVVGPGKNKVDNLRVLKSHPFLGRFAVFPSKFDQLPLPPAATELSSTAAPSAFDSADPAQTNRAAPDDSSAAVSAGG